MARQRITHTATKTRDPTLLATKLFIPVPTSTLVARPRLTALLTAGARRAATLVSAPAGWGKTTLLSAWYADLSGSGYPFAWVSLDADDNDPVRFWSYVLVALNTLHDGASDAALTLLRSPQPPPVEPVLTSVLNAFTTLSKDAVLVLDDYHVIETQPIHRAMIYLLEHLPPRLHLVIATRVDPPMPLARLRVRGVLTEVRAVDLRFTFEETAAFLTEAMGLPLTARQISALDARTEGWIAGLQLAALSARGRPAEHLEQFIEAFTGSNRYVVEYLAEEVLAQQTDETQTFLLRTAVLDRMCAPLCDAVLNRDKEGASYNQSLDASTHLEQLERANLFLISLDDEGNWYRYHHLFAGVLRSRLQQTQARLVPELHRRASAWYEQHGLFDEAVQHALAARDFERADRLIEQVGLAVGIGKQVHTVLGWINSIPEAFVRTRPTLCIYHAVALMFTNQLEAAEARLQDAERCFEAGNPTDKTRVMVGRIATVRANLARFTGDLARCARLSHQGLELLPETEKIFLASARANLGLAYLVSGDVTPGPERLVTAVIAPVRASGNVSATLRGLTLLARLHVLQGRLHQAAATYREAVQVAPGQESLQVVIGSPAYYFGMGDVLREWNNLDAAADYLAQGMDHLRGTLSVDAEVVTLGYTTQARLNWERGDYGMALATLDEFEQLARRRNFVAHLGARGFAVCARIELARGNLAAAIHWAETSGLSTGDIDLSYPREREYLILARVRIAQARNGQNAQVLRDTLCLLDRLLHDAESKARVHSAIEILILQALALQAQGNNIEALTALARAVTLGEPEGYCRLFLDEGEPLLQLLSQLLATSHRASNYIHTLLAAGKFRGREKTAPPYRSKEPHSGQSQPLPDPLSERELEVLHLMASGDSNYEIAEQLVVAVSTVKRHVSNIFSKLDVTNRTQAVARAREFGML
ncbi:MAG TPA: LuxR C-terminal-related transcriptional regulator [Ktedonobacteraceae bacterium]